MTSKNTLPPHGHKHKTAKLWLQRHLGKEPPGQRLSAHDDGSLRRRISIKRPRTAPSSSLGGESSHAPATPVDLNQSSPSPHVQTLISQRPSSGVVRTVDAWLDTTSTSATSPPLMGGLSYWRTATTADVRGIAGIQHAIPIVRERSPVRPTPTHGQQARLFRRGPKKLQVQMPLLSRSKSQRTAARKQLSRRSHSVPVLGLPYENMTEGEPPALTTATRCRPGDVSSTRATASSAHRDGQQTYHEAPRAPLRFRYASPSSAHALEAEPSLGRRMGAFFGRASRSGDSSRPCTAHMGREDSLGDLSDAPTYFSGLPPPSYRSRGTSVLSTSSFGCIDGMNPEYRHVSQQRAAEERSVKSRLRRLAQNLAS